MYFLFAPGGIYLSLSLSLTEGEEAQKGESAASHQGNGAPAVEHYTSGIVVETMLKEVKVRYGEEVVLQCRAHTTDNGDLNYQWYWKKGEQTELMPSAQDMYACQKEGRCGYAHDILP